MSIVLQPFGLRPNYNTTGLTRALPFPATSYVNGVIQRNYDTTATFVRNQPVTLNSAGQLIVTPSAAAAATNTQIYGVFQGAEYVDSSGRIVESPWFQDGFITTTVDPMVRFFIMTDFVSTTFDIQFEAALTSPFSNIVGGEFNFSTTAGRLPTSYFTIGTESANSSMALAVAEVASGTQGQVRVIGLSRAVAYPAGSSNYWNDAFPIVEVQIANTSSLAPKPNL